MKGKRLVPFASCGTFFCARTRNVPSGVDRGRTRDSHGAGRNSSGGSALDLQLFVLEQLSALRYDCRFSRARTATDEES